MQEMKVQTFAKPAGNIITKFMDYSSDYNNLTSAELDMTNDDGSDLEELDTETEEIMTDMFGEGGKEEVKENYLGKETI